MSKISVPPEHKCLPVSVVITSLGGPALETTIEHLLTGKCLPNEIILCVPSGVSLAALTQEYARVRILWTPCRGQVAQRALGLTEARNHFVIQMDDDAFLPATALGELFSVCLRLGPRSAVAPLFKNYRTNEYLTQYRRSPRGFLRSILSSVVGGAAWGTRRMGTIDMAGIPYAVDQEHCKGVNLVETQWLPGGCVICRKEDLVTYNYYPYSGKAYSEDIIHSVIWRHQGVRLWIATNISVGTVVTPVSSSLIEIWNDYRARAFVVSLTGGSLTRCRLWYLLFVMRQMASWLF